eukprot:TRINITY_DN78124_c0_g1_i1.p1 TRINITY_DN78124_c0_g1~~TRINITY_DN78124_c0_g1_i1.p1  ORF type:complete len:780 (+),score=132.95 TRINITY_DN78124_c0_g1_i1:192-2531(+)
MSLQEGNDSESKIVLKVLRAKLTKNFEVMMAKMDPYCIVSFVHATGDMYELSRTRVDWNAHKAPVWEHTCRTCAHCPGSGSSFRFQVMEANVMKKDADCGFAEILVDELVADLSSAQLGQVRELPLKLKGTDTGTIHVQALLLNKRHSSSADHLEFLTEVPAELFESPVTRLGVSGGTAPFFKLQLCKARQGVSKEYYIGKDLSRASDEVTFYEEVKALSSKENAQWFLPLAEFMFEYAGILKTHEEGKQQKEPLELLVLRNLHDGCKKLRLLDIKVGQKTAQAGWQGKSRIAALRQSLIDGITNSAGEGFRLEGFDGRPETLVSMDPLLDIGGKDVVNNGTVKKATRIMLQRMTAADMLLHFLDLHKDLENPDEPKLQDVLSQTEMAEIVLHEVTVKILRLAVACHKSAVPQKWIGSSVALGFDSGSLPSRSGGEANVRRATIVSIFDWGRSELNTVGKHDALSEQEKHDRAEYWRYYSGGIDRLSWEVARAYNRRFCNAGRWDSIEFRIFDFDSMSRDDFMCSAVVPVQSTPETTINLTVNTEVLIGDGLAKIDSAIRGTKPRMTYSMQWREFPAGSRLKGSWLVTVKGAEDIPRRDLLRLSLTSDPYVEIIAISNEGFSFKQQSTIKARSLDPQWNESFEVPVAKTENGISAVLAEAGLTTDAKELSSLFPSERPLSEPASGLFAGFSSLLPTASSQLSGGQGKSAKSLGDLTEERMQIWRVLLDGANLPTARRVTRLTEELVDDNGLIKEPSEQIVVMAARNIGCGCSSNDCVCM